MSGSYIVIEMVEFAGCGSIVILAPADHAALRHSDVHGNLGGGGVGVQSWNGNNVSNVVIYGNLIHDTGDVRASYDQDVHGIAVGRNVSHLWVVDNKLYRNSGDGIQINAGNAGSQSTTHHIYVGRNQAFQNKQSGFWVKQAVDVIFSENLSFSHRPSNSSPGACMGAQYAPEYIWFVNNQVWDCDYGIQIASDNDQGVGKAQFIVGNVIARIHDSDGGFNPDSAWHNCGISLPGGTFRYVLENSLWDVDSGVCVPHAHGAVLFFDNAIEGVRSNGYHVFAESPALANAFRTARANLFRAQLSPQNRQRGQRLPTGDEQHQHGRERHRVDGCGIGKLPAEGRLTSSQHRRCTQARPLGALPEPLRHQHRRLRHASAGGRFFGRRRSGTAVGHRGARNPTRPISAARDSNPKFRKHFDEDLLQFQ